MRKQLFPRASFSSLSPIVDEATAIHRALLPSTKVRHSGDFQLHNDTLKSLAQISP
jgi:hypothetical protein